MDSLVRKSLKISLSLLSSAIAQGQFVKVGRCQPAVDWGHPEIHCLSSAFGKIYLGYGTLSGHPGPVILTSYDPVSQVVLAEHSLNTDSLGAMREIDGRLYIPSLDPIHYQHFEDFTIIHADGHIERRTPVGFLHLFDIFRQESGEFWTMGSQRNNEWDILGGTIFKSDDGGVSWLSEIPPINPGRHFWGFEDAGGIHFSGARYSNGWQVSDYSYAAADEVHSVVGAGGKMIFLLAGKTPGFAGRTGDLVRIPAVGAPEILRQAVSNYAIDDSRLLILNGAGTEIFEVQDATVSPFLTLPLAWAPPVPFSSLHVLDGVLYAGSRDGDLYAARLDGAPIVGIDFDFQNSLPDRAGEKIVISGNEMAIGVPRAASRKGGLSKIDAGKVVLYRRESASAPWIEERVIVEDFESSPDSGSWFGSHFDLNSDQLLIVSGGAMEDGDRGRGARLWSYRKEGSEWVPVSNVAAGYCHDVALAGNQIYASLDEETLRSDDLQLTGFTRDTSAGEYYNPYGVIAYDSGAPDLVFVGHTSDLSRGGGEGKVTVYDPSAANFEPFQVITTQAGEHARFGYSLEYKNGLLAVGAPFSDLAGSQAGAVSLFRRVANGQLVHEATLTALDAESEDGFGHAVALTEGGILYVSAPSANTPAGRRGAVYAFRNTGMNWEQLAKFTPGEDAVTTWEFGMSLEADGHRVMVASAQVDQSIPYLERMTILPPASEGILEWARFQGVSEDEISPLNLYPNQSCTQLEAYALRTHEGIGPRIHVDEGVASFQFFRRTDAASRGLAYTVQVSSGLESWTVVEEVSVTPVSPGWEEVRVPMLDMKKSGRILINFGD